MMRFAAFSAACLTLAAPAVAGTASPIRVAQAQPAGWVRGTDPTTTGSVEAAPTAPARPPCPPDRRVGTGAGFCLIN